MTPQNQAVFIVVVRQIDHKPYEATNLKVSAVRVADSSVVSWTVIVGEISVDNHSLTDRLPPVCTPRSDAYVSVV